MMPPKPLTVEKLSDHFGDYRIILRCQCGHVRTADPRTFAALMGWDARLADVAKRMRCSKCGERACQAEVRQATKRDNR